MRAPALVSLWLLLAVACAPEQESLTPKDAHSSDVQQATDDTVAAPQLGPFHLGMQSDEARKACVAAGGRFVSPNRRRDRRGCRGEQLALGEASIERFDFHLDHDGRIHTVRAHARADQAQALSRYVQQNGGNLEVHNGIVVAAVTSVAR